MINGNDVPVDLPVGTPWSPQFLVKTPDTSGAFVAATGLTATVFLSATKAATTATPINPLLSASCSERGGTVGLYYPTSAVAPATLQTLLLPTYKNVVVYDVLQVAGVVQAYQARIVRDR